MLCDRCYKSNDDNVSIKYYCFSAGYGSIYDTVDNNFIGNFTNEEEFIEEFPWDDICDDCITDLIKLKKLELHQEYEINSPLYTKCCDTYFDDFKNLIRIETISHFPYASETIAYVSNDHPHYYQETRLYLDNNKDFPYSGIICLKCFEPYKSNFLDEENSIRCVSISPAAYYEIHNSNFSPIHYPLKNVLEFEKHIAEHFPLLADSDEIIAAKIIIKAYQNMNKIKKELNYYIGKRNLKIVNLKYLLPKDIFNLILAL